MARCYTCPQWLNSNNDYLVLIHPAYLMHWRISTSRLATLNRRPVSNPTSAEGSPISRVPDDVLYLVFAFVARAEPIRGIHDISQKIPDQENPTYHECLGWMRLSAICRRWRTVLLTSASLWADVVFFLPPGIASLALARSGGASLDIHIPCTKGSPPPRDLKSSKSWGLPHTHRERLLHLAAAHALRMKRFAAADLTTRHYQIIFGNMTFDSLYDLDLAYEYHSTHTTPAPTRKGLGYLCIFAPHAYRARLSIALPIAYNGGQGLSLWLPNLRYLYLDTVPVDQLTNATDLRWIAPLIRGAVGLQHLKMEFPANVIIDWNRLYGEDPLHLLALCSVDLGGPLRVRMDQLLSRLCEVVPPWMRFRSNHLNLRDGLEFIKLYGEIIGHSLCTYPLDSMHISAQEWWEPFMSIFSLTAFSSDNLTGSHPCLDDLLENVHRSAYHSAGLEVRFQQHTLKRDALDTLTPLLAQDLIREIFLDGCISNKLDDCEWENAMRRFMHSCLSAVTTLHCIEARRNNIFMSYILPCTAALRVLIPRDDPMEQVHLQGQELEPSDSASNHQSQVTTPPYGKFVAGVGRTCLLPALHTVVVSMRVADYETKNGYVLMSVGIPSPLVRLWWDELVKALRYRCEIGLPLRTLRIIGGWTSEKVRGRTAKLDGKMLRCVTELVNELIDERKVDPKL
ncbi:hypothetical protein PENSPDRAFT_693024 [Peniophora sp. CONT]|nr:hypothetical protein PENSPDRAFT_693024 [Peniophora sp. CONT]